MSRRERIEAKLREQLAKVFPDHWSFLLGEVALHCFVVLVLTGLALTFFYDASSAPTTYDGSYTALQGVEVSRAFASVVDLSFDVTGGILLRQTHHWAAVVFVAVVAVHAGRIFFTGAFRRPRRLNWMVGVTLLAAVMANGWFGLSLTDDLLAGTGTRIGYTTFESVPVVGPAVADLVFAGEFPSDGMITRMFWIHVLVLPLLIGGLIATHLGLIFRQSHTQFPTEEQREDNVVGDRLWPAHVFKTTGLLLAVVAVLVALGSLVQINPVWLYGPFDPAAATVPAQPDWFLGWVEGALRVFFPVSVVAFGRELPTPLFSGVLGPLMVFATLYAWPFVEERLTGDRRDHHLLGRPRDHPARTALGAGGLAFLGVLLAAGSHDVQGQMLGVGVDAMTTAYRVLLVVVPVAVALVVRRVCRDLVAAEQDPDAAPEPPPGLGAEAVEVGR